MIYQPSRGECGFSGYSSWCSDQGLRQYSNSEAPLLAFLCSPSSKSACQLHSLAHVFAVLRLFAYPLGKLLAWTMPFKRFTFPDILGALTLDLNPGPFNIKENTLIIIMGSMTICPSLHATTAAKLYLGANLDGGWVRCTPITSGIGLTTFCF